MESTGEPLPTTLFQALVDRWGGASGAGKGRGFGSDALKIDGKIFAALSRGRLLLKLPSERVDALIERGIGERFSTGTGRPKKEWVTIAPKYVALWEGLAEEACRHQMRFLAAPTKRS
jgi:hypothetical protein